jgi:hypothetical protein
VRQTNKDPHPDVISNPTDNIIIVTIWRVVFISVLLTRLQATPVIDNLSRQIDFLYARPMPPNDPKLSHADGQVAPLTR